MGWGPDEIRSLRELADAGLSNAQIAEEMNLTEDAIRAMRLRLIGAQGAAPIPASNPRKLQTPRGPIVHWPDEKIERLKDLAKKGWTSSAIAKDLGGLSRSAVLGKLPRLGISLGSKTAVKELIAHTNKQRAKAKPPKIIVEKPSPPAEAPAPVAEDQVDAVADDGDDKTLAARFARAFSKTAPDGSIGIPYSKRALSQCAWPLEELHGPAAKRCCGAAVRGAGEPYCAHHARIAYQPRAVRVKDSDPDQARKIALRLALARMGQAKAREAEAAKYRRTP